MRDFFFQLVIKLFQLFRNRRLNLIHPGYFPILIPELGMYAFALHLRNGDSHVNGGDLFDALPPI